MNTIILLFGMEGPSIWGFVLSYLIVGLIGFAICYIHRYLVFVVVPIFFWLAYYMNNGLSQDLPNHKMLGLILTLFSFFAIVFGAILSWRKNKSPLKTFS
ncbi:MAG: hypothetical protein M3033_01595 [Acidobacteriota bacterium]|nr:hypothetical protein [Acidobacteriota bacterium]